MSQYKRKKTKKKKSFFGTFIKLIFIFGILAALVFGAVKLAPEIIGDKMEDIKRLQYPQKYQEYVEEYSSLYNVDESLVYGVIHTESHFNKDTTSGAGAMGLMQITPECFDFLKKNIPNDATDYDDSCLFDPEINIKFGTYFLSYLLERYDNAEQTALAAYNAGFGSVDDWLQNPDYSGDGENLDNIPYPETSDYVVKVEKAKEMYNRLY